jgi:hypothetical protein
VISASEVSACLVTRGDQPEMMESIYRSLIGYAEVVVWDNSVQQFDAKTAGRYYAAGLANKDVVYFQDDDVLVPRETQEALLEAYEPGVVTAVYAHGENPDGYDDLPLVGVGAILDRQLAFDALDRYTENFPMDDGFFYEADFVAGVLYPKWKHLHLPFEINMPVAQHPSRLCNQPWQKELKLQITNQARLVRGYQVAA